MRTVIILSTLIQLLTLCSAHAMTISVSPEKVYVLNLSGEIVKDDCAAFIKAVRDKGGFPAVIYIESPGGDVKESICMGQLIRKAALTVSVHGQCNSACVLIWGAAVHRIADDQSSFGVHRPIYDPRYFSKLSPVEAQEEYKKLDLLVRNYLSDINFPDSIVDKMMATKSSQIEHISGDALLNFVGEYSPAYQEWIIAKCGELTDSEKQDYFSTRAEMMVNAGFDLPKKDEVWIKEKAKYSETLSTGYKEYLAKKANEIGRCEVKAVEEMQQTILLDE